MLDLHPPLMLHAPPRSSSYDMYGPSAMHRFEPPRQMQLPVPRATAPRPPHTPPADDVAPAAYHYQLPPVAHCKSTVARQPPQPPQDMAPEPPKKWNIAPNLRIPSSIKTPQESLSQLAAEVTCFFWFENSSTLQHVLGAASPCPTQPLAPDAIPTTGFRKWVTTILTTTQVASNVILLALLFIYRLKNTNPKVKGRPGSEYRLLTVALMLGNKFLDDNTYTNKTWAEVTGISVQEVHVMEVEFLSNMRYSLFTTQGEWDEWHVLLGKFGTFCERAARVPLYPPRVTLEPSLSPPIQQISPPTTVSLSPSGSQSSNTPGLTTPATAPSAASSAHPPELGPIQRKRSTDHAGEPAPKRPAYAGQAYPNPPPSYTSAPSIPPLYANANRPVERPQGVNRLPPLPNLSIPTPQQTPPVLVNNWSDLTLPAPGNRSMAMVYPVHWKQPFVTPTSTAAPQYPISQSQTPTAGDRSYSVSPYHASPASSPTSANPCASSNPRQLSPSYFLNQRQSPYRPVRGVHTLLVPPPSTSMHDTRNIGYEQMQYQPLGKSNTERRVGPLPYMDQRAWPETQHYHQLAVPQSLVYQG